MAQLGCARRVHMHHDPGFHVHRLLGSIGHHHTHTGNTSKMFSRDNHHRLCGLQVAQSALVPNHKLVLSDHVKLLFIRRESH